MSDYISREAAINLAQSYVDGRIDANDIARIPAADVRPVVTCQECMHAEPFDRNCVLNSTAYMHCKLYRGSEVKNAWHKYKKYYKDYSVVDRDGYCSEWFNVRGGQDNG